MFNDDVDEQSKKNLGCTLVATFGTETSRSAILTACRGYRSEAYPAGIDNDVAQYMSSLAPSERGFVWSLHDIVYGNEAKDRKPVTAFVNKVNEYPGLLDIMMGIENLINKRSSHASGVVMFENDPYDYCCFMRTPTGEIITQWDLHMVEAAGSVKYDLLVTSNQDKIRQTLVLLQQDGLVEKDLSIRQLYDKYLHPDVIDIEDKEVWHNIQQNNITSLFQFDSPIGGEAIAKVQPKNMLELSDTNGLTRLMTNEKGAETPIDKYVRFKNNINLWYQEMKKYGLTADEVEAVRPYFESSYGVPVSQELMMRILMDENICGFSLGEANAARKVVAKKQMSKIAEFKEKVFKRAKSQNLARYVWSCGIALQLGYSFSVIHALAYSYIGYQNAYLATKWNPVYWNTACLIVDSNSLEDDDDETVDEIIEAEKKNKGTDYAKVAKAVNTFVNRDIEVSLIDINKSDLSFKPDAENNKILYGLNALSGINEEIISKIIAGRPYLSFLDFMNRCPLNKLPMISLIKSGAFDSLEQEWSKSAGVPARYLIMALYLHKTSDLKQTLNLRNFNGLLQYNLIPDTFAFEKTLFRFNKELKDKCKWKDYYILANGFLDFYNKFCNPDYLEYINGIACILQKKWDKMYTTKMDTLRQWLRDNQSEVVKKYNDIVLKENWDKYAQGNLSAWEMDALCFYYHEHELSHINYAMYGLADYSALPQDPEVEYMYRKTIPIYKLTRIAGTVIAKNNTRSTVTILTTTGVVDVKFSKEYYAKYACQISEIQEDGKKKIVEKGWFRRGVKILCTGYRREDTFVAKTYKNTVSHQIYIINKINKDGTLELSHERYEQDSQVS